MAQPGVPVKEGMNAPALVVWEASREAEPNRRWRDELSTMEAMRLLNEVRCFGRIPFLLVGRPLRRADVCLLLEHGARIGLSMRLAAGPDPLHEETVTSLRDAGLQRIVIDGDARATPVLLEEVARSRVLGLGVHVTTRVTPEVIGTLSARGRALAEAGVHVWTLGFPLKAGELRGAALDDALRKIITVAGELPMQLEVAGAPQVRRVLAECGAAADRVAVTPREGSGLLFVSAEGSVLPAPDLPLVLGNVRDEDVLDLYQDAPVMCALRDPTRLRGKCSHCEFVYVCGGSRARAHAAAGDWLAPDPACSYAPGSFERERPAAASS